MQLVVADTGPINYLVLIGQIEFFPVLFDKVVLPKAVSDELSNPKAPYMVRSWMANTPSWIEVRRAARETDDAALSVLDEGERAAIVLAGEIDAGLILMDDRKASLPPGRKDSGWLELSVFSPLPPTTAFSTSPMRSNG